MPALSVRTSSNEEFGNLSSGFGWIRRSLVSQAFRVGAGTRGGCDACGNNARASVRSTPRSKRDGPADARRIHRECRPTARLLPRRGRDSARSLRDQRPYQCGTIWVMAAAGIVIGAGYGGAGLALSLLILALITVIALTICPAIVKGLPCFSPSVIDIIVKIAAPRLTRVNVRKPTGFSFRVRSIPTIAPHSTATRIRTTVAQGAGTRSCQL